MITFTNALNTSHKKEEMHYRAIKVVAVVDNLSIISNKLLEIKALCIKERIMFITRVYNSDQIWEDRDIIERLPALHIYINKGYNRTFYPNTRPFQHIEESIDIHDIRVERNKQRRRYWSTLYSRIYKSMYNLFRKKTKIEQRQEEARQEQARNWS